MHVLIRGECRGWWSKGKGCRDSDGGFSGDDKRRSDDESGSLGGGEPDNECGEGVGNGGEG